MRWNENIKINSFESIKLSKREISLSLKWDVSLTSLTYSKQSCSTQTFFSFQWWTFSRKPGRKKGGEKKINEKLLPPKQKYYEKVPYVVRAKHVTLNWVKISINHPRRVLLYGKGIDVSDVEAAIDFPCSLFKKVSLIRDKFVWFLLCFAQSEKGMSFHCLISLPLKAFDW